jgi:hypothetical protein
MIVECHLPLHADDAAFSVVAEDRLRRLFRKVIRPSP